MAETFFQRGHGMHPYSLANVQKQMLARMLPLSREQRQVYKMGEKHPPGLEGYGPTWEAVNAVLAARSTLQMRVNLQRDFHLLALAASSSSNVNGGFRAQMFDSLKRRRFADRGVNFANIAGGAVAGFYLRDPYRFDQPDSQVLVMMQNLETVQNTVQLVLYGVALRFNEAGGLAFPGGPIK